MLKDKPNWYPRYSKLNLEYDEAIEKLTKFKPIRCKDRMPNIKDFPVLIWYDDDGGWVPVYMIYSVSDYTHWMPMPPKPE